MYLGVAIAIILLGVFVPRTGFSVASIVIFLKVVGPLEPNPPTIPLILFITFLLVFAVISLVADIWTVFSAKYWEDFLNHIEIFFKGKAIKTIEITEIKQ